MSPDSIQQAGGGPPKIICEDVLEAIQDALGQLDWVHAAEESLNLDELRITDEDGRRFYVSVSMLPKQIAAT